jgi:hypothetical protein
MAKRKLDRWRKRGRTVEIDPTPGRRWVANDVTSDEYFRAARQAARREAREELDERLAEAK